MTYAGAFGGRNHELTPSVAFGGPFVEVEAASVTGSGEKPDIAVGGGEHGAERVVEFVGDVGGFVDDEKRDGGEATEGVGLAGEGDDAGGVGEKEGIRVAGSAADGEVE